MPEALRLLAQTHSDVNDITLTASHGSGLCVGIIGLGIVAWVVAGLWKVFVKAGQPGWAAIVPIYNLWILLKIAGRPARWLILLLIPFVNIVFGIPLGIDIAARFGKSTPFGAGLALLGFIFFPILGFSDAVYQPIAMDRGFPITPNSPPGVGV